jgi:hypothetical protein
LVDDEINLKAVSVRYWRKVARDKYTSQLILDKARFLPGTDTQRSEETAGVLQFHGAVETNSVFI